MTNYYFLYKHLSVKIPSTGMPFLQKINE